MRRVQILILGVGVLHSIFQAVSALPILLTTYYDIESAGSFLHSMLVPIVSLDRYDFYQSVVVMIPGFIIVFIAADFMSDDFCRFGTYVLTRQNEKLKWYIRTTLRITWNCALYPICSLVLSVVLCIPILAQLILSTKIILTITAFLLITTLHLSVSVLTTNLLAMRFGSHIGMTIFVCGILASLTCAYVTSFTNASWNDWLARLNPTVNAILDWHTNIGSKDILSSHPYLTMQYSSGYLFLLYALIWVCGYIYINNADVI